MLDKIRALFSEGIADNGDSEAALHLAAAILLVEIANPDQGLDDVEIRRP